jgi:hypothetical protein
LKGLDVFEDELGCIEDKLPEGKDLTPEELEEKPYPNEHACRLNPTGKYRRIRRVNCDQKHDGKCIDVLYGVRKSDGKSEIQALRYPKKEWTAASARSHCKGRDGTFEAAGQANIEPVRMRPIIPLSALPGKQGPAVKVVRREVNVRGIVERVLAIKRGKARV